MAKTHSSDAYGRLVRILIVLFVLVVISVAGYVLMDKSIQAQLEENTRRAQEENAQLEAQYQQAKAEEAAKAEQGESLQWPTPKAEGWDVLDLTEYPLLNPVQVTAGRQELLLGGMLLINRWHPLPLDLPEDELVGVYATDKTIPVSSSSVRLFPAAVSALSEMLAAAKADGLENFLIDEGYRTNETQDSYYQKAAERYADKYSGEALIEVVREKAGVNNPGTSEYQSGFSFRVRRYLEGDKEFNDSSKFGATEHSAWLLENSWKHGFVFRFPVMGYPNETVTDKAYKTGEDQRLSIYRYVGKANAAVMHTMDFCMEEYIEYLMAHPHIAVYENGELRYEITRLSVGDTTADVTAEITRSAKDYTLSTDNMGGVIVTMSY